MDELTKQVRRAHRRLGWQRFVDSLGWCVTAALVIGLLLVVLGKFCALGLPIWVWPVAALGLGIAVAMVWSLATRPAPLDAAVEIDRRFALSERVSTALALSPSERKSGPGQAILEDAARRVSRLDVGARFKTRPGRQLLLPLAPAAAVLLAALLIPTADGNSTAQAKANATAGEEQVKRSSEDLVRRLAEQRKRAEQEGLEESRQLLKKLEEGSKELTRQTDRKSALVKLRELSQQLQERRQQLGGAEQVKQQLNQLKAGPKGPAEKFAQDISRGDFNKALQELEKLKEQLANNKLDQVQKEQLAKQLEEMQRKLQDMAAAHQAAQQNLTKQLDAAAKAGQTAEANRLQQQLDKLAMQNPQMQQLSNLGQKLGQCSQCMRDGKSGKASQAMQDAQSSLAQMKQQLDELKTLDSAMANLDQAREQMTCSKCGGAGCKACQGGKEGPGEFTEGDGGQGMSFQAGGGGLGKASGARPEKKNNTAFYDSQVKQQNSKGSSTAAGTTGGPNVKGNVFQEIQQRAETAKHGDVDPLTDQRMPREHREHAREYFDRLRKGE